MTQKLSNRDFIGHGPIKVLYPGKNMSTGDSGMGAIGRIDHAFFKGHQLIAMHPHVNDEILSYFRTGTVRHKDSEGFEATIDGKHLMLMKAGKLFYHEEDIDGTIEPQEGLQIFIRPGEPDLEPEVIFYDLDEVHSLNKWRLLASPTAATPLKFSSQTWIYDTKLTAGHSIEMPKKPNVDLTALLYVFQGEIMVNHNMPVQKQEALIIKDKEILINTEQGAELVLFFTDEKAPFYSGGMFSGNHSKQ